MSDSENMIKFDVITLDTNIFTDQGYNLEGGLLAQLSQFKDATYNFILSEIVVREMLSHISDRNIKERQKLIIALKNNVKRNLLDAQSRSDIEKILSQQSCPKDVAENRVKEFLNKTGGIVIPVSGIDASELVDLYFSPKPPFENNIAKKNEFPDAIALLSLEKWARKENKKILAISKDKGWRTYADQSPQLSVIPDLATALSGFQEHSIVAHKLVNDFLTFLDEGKSADEYLEIQHDVINRVSSIYPTAEAESYFRFEDNGVELNDPSFEFINDKGQYKFSIVRMGSDTIVAKISIIVSAVAEAEFVFSVYDEGEVYIGGCTAQTPVEFESSIILTLNAEFEEDDSDRIKEIEIVDLIDAVDFGAIEPDYSNDYDDEPDMEGHSDATRARAPMIKEDEKW